MKYILALSILLSANFASAGVCKSDYQTTSDTDFAYTYSSSASIEDCQATSREYPEENFIYKVLDEGAVIAVLFIKNGNQGKASELLSAR